MSNSLEGNILSKEDSIRSIQRSAASGFSYLLDQDFHSREDAITTTQTVQIKIRLLCIAVVLIR